MIVLLDTHVLLWWLDDPGQLLSVDARDTISEPNNVVIVSSVSVWEIAIKRSLGKLSAPTDLASAITSCGFSTLPISVAHALATESLPMHHRDPFDRMLLAQASIEKATIVTRDPQLAAYGLPIVIA